MEFQKRFSIHPEMMKSGLRYYMKGQVRRLHFDNEKNGWRTRVKGNRNDFYYFVDVSDNDATPFFYCDCPSSLQPCKHIVASLFAIEDYEKTGKFTSGRFSPRFFFKNLIRLLINQ